MLDTENLDVAARMAEIIGKPARIAPYADDEVTAEARELSAHIRSAFGVTDNAKMPQVFAVMAKHPGLFKAQMDMGVQLVGKGQLSGRDRELAILRNAWLCGAPYEWGEHVDISQRHGITHEEIERCTVGSTAPEWNGHERAIMKGVEELHADKMISDATWAVLAQSWSEAQLMEFPVLIGQYISTALLQNSLRVRLAGDNPGLEYR